MPTTKEEETPERSTDTNPDPLTGEPGSHPVGTGVGAAAGGAAGAAVGSVAGPIGTAIGAVIGAVAGGYGGKGVAEMIDPTAEDAYWQEHHDKQPYARGTDEQHHEDYMAAYRAGYTGYRQGETFDQVEADVRLRYEDGPQNREANKVRVGHVPPSDPESKDRLEWAQAREAARAAYDRIHHRASESGTKLGGMND